MDPPNLTTPLTPSLCAGKKLIVFDLDGTLAESKSWRV
jgi:hypothetical protein